MQYQEYSNHLKQEGIKNEEHLGNGKRSFYDGQDAYVAKFIVKGDDDDTFYTVNPDSEALIKNYISGNGELLKIDILYSVDFDNIVALKDADEPELRSAYHRFKQMYF